MGNKKKNKGFYSLMILLTGVYYTFKTFMGKRLICPVIRREASVFPPENFISLLQVGLCRSKNRITGPLGVK